MDTSRVSARPSPGDVRIALRIVALLHEDVSPDPIPPPVLRALQGLLDADSAAGFVDVPTVGPVREWVTRPAPPWLGPLLHKLGRQDPIHRDHCAGERSSVAISDRLSRAEFERRPVFRMICAPLAVGDSLRLYLPAPAGAARFLFFDRSRRGFPAPGRAVLDLLRPHLAVAVARRAAFARSAADVTSAATTGLTRRQRDVLTLVAAGHTNAQIACQLSLAEPTVRKHLENAYDRLGVHTRTAAVAALNRTLPAP